MEGKNKQVKISKCPFILYTNLLLIITILCKKIEKYLLKLYEITFPFLGKGEKKDMGV